MWYDLIMKKEDLPNKIPVFPLSNFIIFPKTTVPLNIFEPRYIDMINDSMKSNKLIGMIQPKTSPVCNASMRNGRTIEQFVPKSLDDVVLPKKKSKRKKLMKIAQRYGLTHEEVLVLSDPFLFPHPYVTNKTGIGSEFKSFSRL